MKWKPPNPDAWLMTDEVRSERAITRTYLSIPNGETAEGFGRTWDRDSHGVEMHVVSFHPDQVVRLCED